MKKARQKRDYKLYETISMRYKLIYTGSKQSLVTGG